MQYADDTQLYVGLKDENALPALTNCIHALHHWLNLNGLSLNPKKSEAIIIGTSARQRVEQVIGTIDTSTAHVQVSHSVKSLSY